MQNRMPRSPVGLFALAGEVLDGVKKYGGVLPLLHNTEAKFNVDLAALSQALENYGGGVLELKARRLTLLEVIGEAKDFVITGRDRLKKEYGSRYSDLWRALHFIGTLQVEDNPDDLIPKLGGLKGLYTLQPGKQILEINLTAAEADVLITKLRESVGGLNEQDAVVTGLFNTRNTAARKMRKRIRGVIKELSDLLDPLDERWKEFGLNMPGQVQAPEVPEDVVAALGASNTITVTWERPARAEYYRVWKRVLGTDAELVAAGSPADLNFTIENLPANAQVEVAVSAVNAGGESGKSVPVTVAT